MFDIQARALELSEKMAAFAKLNHRLAVEEPENDFEKAYNDYELLVQLNKEFKRLAKVISDEELAARKAFAGSLVLHFGAGIKEGTNTYPLSNGRKIKLGHNFTRSVDSAMIKTARGQFEAVPQSERGDVLFDSLFRVKHEIQKKEYGKLMQGGSALVALSVAVTTKPATPTLELD